ncbi:MAG: MoaD/ThiS family protein [Thermodesulfobacteriota bacterium]
MQIRVKLFATLTRHGAHANSGTSLVINIAEDATIADLIKKLQLPPEEVKVVFVNGRARPYDWRLKSGDEVGLFPPIGGG